MARESWIVVSSVWLLFSCSSSRPAGDGSEGQTHWLSACDAHAECGGLSCICGVCIAACSAAGACAVEGRVTECQQPDAAAAVTLCAGEAPMPICLEPCDSECPTGQRCAQGVCMPDDNGSTGGSGGEPSGSGGGGSAGGGGNAGTGTPDAGSSDAGTPSDDAGTPAMDAGPAPDGGSLEVNCIGQPPVFPSFDRSCNQASDCVVATRLASCCGTQRVTGIRTAELSRYQQAAAECASQFPLCGCFSDQKIADDGSMTAMGSTAEPDLDCVQGTCTTSFPGTTTACGPSLTCNPATEVCVAREPVGPSIQYSCQAVPAGCESDRTCGCMGATLCQSPFDACSELGANVLDCACLQCQ